MKRVTLKFSIDWKKAIALHHDRGVLDDAAIAYDHAGTLEDGGGRPLRARDGERDCGCGCGQ